MIINTCGTIRQDVRIERQVVKTLIKHTKIRIGYKQ